MQRSTPRKLPNLGGGPALAAMVVVFVAGLALGWGAAVLSLANPRSEHAPALSENARGSTVPAPQAPPLPCAPQVEQPAPDRPEVEALETCRARLAAFTGETSTWPDDVRAPFTPNALAAALQEALQLSDDATVLGLDCVEYPCIAAFEMVPDAPRLFPAGPRQHPLLAGSRSEVTQSAHLPGGLVVALVPFHGEALAPDVKTRLEYRMEVLVKELGR